MQRKQVDQEKGFAKKNLCHKKFADCIGDSREVLHVIKTGTGSRVQSRHLSGLEVDGYEACDYTEFTNVFNYHFVSVGPRLAQFLPVKKPPKADRRAHQSIHLLRTNENECLEVIQQLDSKHSSGQDNFSNVVLKTSATAIAFFIQELINFF